MAGKTPPKTRPNPGEQRVFRTNTFLALGWVLTVTGGGFGMIWLVRADFTSKISCAPFALLIAAVGFVGYVRPKIVADHEGVTVVNPLQTVRIPWAQIQRFKADDRLRVFRRGSLPPVAVWAIQAANLTRMLGKTSRADQVASELNKMV